VAVFKDIGAALDVAQTKFHELMQSADGAQLQAAAGGRAGGPAARMVAAMMPNMELVYAVRGVMVGFLSLKGLNYSGFCMFL